MKEHKFKTWFPKCKLMSAPWDLSERIKDIVINIKEEQEESDHSGAELFTEGFVNRAYTGCKDKNDKEIYCGDIVRLGGIDIFYVDFMWGSYFLCRKEGDSTRHDELLSEFGFIRKGIEVIGDIYQSPELMDRSKKDL